MKLLCFVFLLVHGVTFSQDSIATSKDWAPLIGYQQFDKSLLEAGISRIRWTENGTVSTLSYGLAAELGVTEKVFGAKSFFRYGSGINVGFNIIYYKEYEFNRDDSFRFRPEIGIGSGFVNLLYGYNLPISNEEFNAINTHLISLQFIFSKKMLKKGLL